MHLLSFRDLHGLSVHSKQGGKSRIRETKNLWTDADSRTNTILKKLRDLSFKKKNIYIYIQVGRLSGSKVKNKLIKQKKQKNLGQPRLHQACTLFSRHQRCL